MPSKKKQTVGYRYFLGMHMGLCHGPVDKINGIFGDEKLAWSGEWTGGQIIVNNTELFGGTDKEGGIAGAFDLEMGWPTQGQNAYLVSRLAPNLVPAYRGICAVVMEQIYVGTQTYLKKLGFLTSRIHVRTSDGIAQWYDSKSQVLSFVNPPVVLFTESFGSDEDTDFDDYTTEAGDRDAFDVVDSGLGGGKLAMAIEGTFTSVSKISKPVAKGIFVGCSFKFALDTKKIDDNGIMEFVDGAGNPVFTFIVAREQFYDGLQRPYVYFSGSPASTSFGAAAVTTGAWYQFNATFNHVTKKLKYTITNIATGVVWATAETTATLGNDVEKLRFSVDGGLNAGTALFTDIVIYSQVTSQDMNPAHIIRECLTDPDWGMGYQDADIDDTTFEDCADVMYSEGLGMSILWNRQTSIEEFIKEVIRHIDATLYVDKGTGKFTLKLIRDDYVLADLIELNESNVEKVSDFTRPTLGELTNSITVQFYDASTYKDSSLTVQDIALSQMQGTTINTTVQYPGFTNSAIASRIAQRDLKTLSTPIASCTIYANRDALPLNIGSVFKFSWDDYELADLPMRVTGIAYGDGKGNRIRLSCTQDVYKLPAAPLMAPVPPAWSDPNTAPEAAEDRLPYEVPYLEAVQQYGQSVVDNLLTSDPSIGYAGISIGRPTQSTINAHMYTDAGAGYNDQGIIDFSPTAKLVANIDKMATSFNIADVQEIDSAPIGSWLQIDNEIMVKVLYVAPTLTVKRGVLDTVPEEHLADAKLFFWDNFSGNDDTQYVDGETIDIKVTPVTAQGELALLSAPVDSIDIVGRMARPYPPADFQINSDYFPVDANTTLDVSWVHRDRKQQTGNVYLGFLDGGVGPEAGTTYTLRLYNNTTSTLLHTESAISGTSFDLTSYAIPAELRIELESIRSGLTSYQMQSHILSFTNIFNRITEAGDDRISEAGDDRITE